jgi:hypothetical protein
MGTLRDRARAGGAGIINRKEETTRDRFCCRTKEEGDLTEVSDNEPERNRRKLRRMIWSERESP